MMNLTKPQRKALKRIYDRHIIGPPAQWAGQRFVIANHIRPTYRQFRRTVKPLLCGDGCAMVAAGGMWIGIETDGYTHT